MTPPIAAPGELPPHAPARADNLGRRLCRRLLRWSGWHLVGEIPDVARLVLIAAPHSSWWDGIWALLVKIGLGLEVRFMAKREVFRGPLGWLLRRLGGIPIDRRSAKGVVEQMIDAYAGDATLWLGITPEGTRRHVPRWKTGFWHIASAAGVPIFPIAFHYPDKAIHLGPLLEPGADMAADIAALRAWYAPFRGKHHGL